MPQAEKQTIAFCFRETRTGGAGKKYSDKSIENYIIMYYNW